MLDDHIGCARASVRDYPGAAREAFGFEWWCCQCGERLAWSMVEGGDLLIDSRLVPLPRRHGTLPAFGLTQRALVRGNKDAVALWARTNRWTASGSAGHRSTPTVRGEVCVVGPARGITERASHEAAMMRGS